MMRRFSLHFLLLINVALAVGLVALWFKPDRSLRGVQWVAPQAKMADYASINTLPPAAVTMDNNKLVAMMDRPLFSLTRRPPPPPPPPPAPAPVDTLSNARLTALYSGAGSGGAVVNQAGKSRRVRLNEGIDGWVLVAIQEGSATFTQGGQVRVLKLARGNLGVSFGLPPLASAPPPSPLAAPPTPQATAAGTQSASPETPARPLGPVFGGSR
jgi:hypothetical protein